MLSCQHVIRASHHSPGFLTTCPRAHSLATQFTLKDTKIAKDFKDKEFPCVSDVFSGNNVFLKNLSRTRVSMLFLRALCGRGCEKCRLILPIQSDPTRSAQESERNNGKGYEGHSYSKGIKEQYDKSALIFPVLSPFTSASA